MATKALHLELVSDLTTEAFIAAYKRFTARRVLCSKIFSDNATTFVSAAKNLRNSFSALHNELPAELALLLSLHGTEWHFIPPNAPNFGGLWEAGVKSVKHHRKRCIGTSTLTFEELYTLLTQTEACVNSRPLYHLSPDPNDLEPLTPGHFLIGSILLTTPEPTLQNEPQNRLSRWKLVQQTYEHFWNRWSTDYLNTLQERTKWKQPSLNLQPGHLIVLREDHLPPSSWALGRIVKVHPGSDGLVRVVSVQTKDQVLQRPITKICLLSISDNRYDNTQQVPAGRAAVSTSSPVIHQPSTSFRLPDEAGGDV